MKFFTKLPALFAVVCLAHINLPAGAVDIASFTGGTTLIVGSPQLVFGQGFTPSGGGPFTNISFNFFSNTPATTPFALGTAFLLSSPYFGTPAALGNGTAGYLGQASASGGFYNFGSSVTLNAGTHYYLYTNTGLGSSSISILSIGVSVDGIITSAPSVNSNFDLDTGIANYRVTGDSVGARTPDAGSTALLLALGMAGLLVGRRSLRH